MATSGLLLRALDQSEIPADLRDAAEGDAPHPMRPWQEPELGFEARVEESLHGECVPMIVTRELAHEWLTERRYDRQRPLSEGHVRFLVEVMKAGEFQPGEVQFRRLDDRLYLVDGQHRLTAIDRCGLAQPMRVFTQAVSSREEIARDYVRLDRNKQRNLSDSYAAFDLEGLLRLGKNDVSRLGAAVQVIDRDFGVHHGSSYSGRAIERRVAGMRAWAVEGRTFFASIQGAQAGLNVKLRMAPTLAVALVTLRHQPEQARGFWRAVALNDGLRAGSPPRALVSYLIGVGQGGRPHEGTVERATARCWSAYYEGKSVQLLQAGDPSKPIRIAGTPYTGERDTE